MKLKPGGLYVIWQENRSGLFYRSRWPAWDQQKVCQTEKWFKCLLVLYRETSALL